MLLVSTRFFCVGVKKSDPLWLRLLLSAIACADVFFSPAFLQNSLRLQPSTNLAQLALLISVCVCLEQLGFGAIILFLCGVVRGAAVVGLFVFWSESSGSLPRSPRCSTPELWQKPHSFRLTMTALSRVLAEVEPDAHTASGRTRRVNGNEVQDVDGVLSSWFNSPTVLFKNFAVRLMLPCQSCGKRCRVRWPLKRTLAALPGRNGDACVS